MNTLADYNEFLFQQLVLEYKQTKDLRVKELEIVLSPRLKEILEDMDHQIAKDLLSYHYMKPNEEKDKGEKYRQFKKTFLDVGSEPNKISFLQSNRIIDFVRPDYMHGDYKRNPNADPSDPDSWMGEFDIVNYWKQGWVHPLISDDEHMINLHDIQFANKKHPVWQKNRGEARVGRFISQMFPNKYPDAAKRSESEGKSPNDIESFVNKYIAAVESTMKMIAEVKGEDIVYWYDCNNYLEEKGSLGGSCMREPKSARLIKFYALNSDKVSMLVLYPEGIRDKIIGRALLWKLDRLDGKDVSGKNVYFMDRIYTANGSDEFLYKEYAKQHGYYNKSQQTYGYSYDIVAPNGESRRRSMEVKLKSGTDTYSGFPFLDTMQFYNPETGWITNDKEIAKSDSGFGVIANTAGEIHNLEV